MYLPNKITDILSKISKSYLAEYKNGKIVSVSISDKNIKIDVSSKGYCIDINGSCIYLDNINGIASLLLKMGAIEKSKNKTKKESSKKDDLVELFSKNKNNFSVEYRNSKAIGVNMIQPNLIVKKNTLGYLVSVNNETISIDSINSLKNLLQKINIVEDEKIGSKTISKSKKQANSEFEQLTLNILI